MKFTPALFSNLKVLIIGDVMIDRYLWGTVERQSPEAPVPVLLKKSEEDRLGGAANVALNIVGLGAQCMLLGVVGDDSNADVFENLLAANGLVSDFIFRSNLRPTTVKTRVIRETEHLLRVDTEYCEALESEEQIEIQELIEKALGESPDLIILQDYNKGLLGGTVIKWIMQKANERNVPVCVDPKKENFFAYQGAFLFKPNLKELREALEQDKTFIGLEDLEETRDEKSPLLNNEILNGEINPGLGAACKYLAEKLGCTYLLLTLSEKGMVMWDGEELIHQPASEGEIVDVSGAGDTVISVAAMALAAHIKVADAMQLATKAAAQVCGQVGVVPVRRAGL